LGQFERNTVLTSQRDSRLLGNWLPDPISQPTTPASYSVSWKPGWQDTRVTRPGAKVNRDQPEVPVHILTKFQLNSSLSVSCLGATAVGDQPVPQTHVPQLLSTSLQLLLKELRARSSA